MREGIRTQAIALPLTAVVCAALIFLLRGEVHLINLITAKDISLHFNFAEMMVGFAIYMKTSIDFSIFIGRLMQKNTGLKSRIAIEIGTAVGNGIGTFLVLLLWALFKEVNWLLAIMVGLASLVLFRLAKDGLEEIDIDGRKEGLFTKVLSAFDKALTKVNDIIDPLLSRILPGNGIKVTTVTKFSSLILMSFTVPFILGLDDFAGYVPLHRAPTVYSFAIGVLVGHMVLNIFLFLSPKRTVDIVKNHVISFIGSVVFVILALLGIKEVIHLLV